MALGSSAPEILLSVIETVTLLEDKPGELGPSTIVGSAAFNLLVISAVSITAVKDPKWINDRGVFYITATSSVFAYVWLFIVLSVWTENVVTLVEAILTFGFFFLLLIMAYAADKFNERKEERTKTKEQKLQDQKDNRRRVAKSKLRELSERKSQ